nr:hypothetical protein [uncultured Draconibacterium sp.]
MDRRKKINAILRAIKGQAQIVTDPSEGFILMQQNIALRKCKKPIITYEFGGALKTAMESLFRTIKAKRDEPKTKD